MIQLILLLSNYSICDKSKITCIQFILEVKCKKKLTSSNLASIIKKKVFHFILTC